MRLFFAVPVSEEVRGVVAGSISSSPLYAAPWRWILPGNYHLTLKFLGETEESRISEVTGAGREAARSAAPFRISFGSFGAFPGLSKPRVLFYGVREGKDELAGLARLVDESLVPAGFTRERKPFRAHLTLARVKRPVDRLTTEKLQNMGPLPEGTRQQVDRFVLMSSRLERAGAVYEEIEHFVLGG